MSTDTKQVNLLYKIGIRGGGSKVGRFLLHFLELQIPMGLGALVCYLVVRLIPASSSFGTSYRPGTFLLLFFLTIPVVASMILRGHGWPASLGIAVAMLTPVAAIMIAGQLAGYAHLLWLITASYPAMSLGMLVYMLYRRDHFTRRAAHSMHIAD